MRHIFTLALCLFAGSLFAQQVEKCGTMIQYREDAAYASRVMSAESKAQEWQRTHTDHWQKKQGITYDIPVVVHIIYNEQDSTQNIPDSVVFSQLAVLNEDFSRQNADASNTRAIFDSVAADTRIRFYLADTDPQGNPSTGITRTATSKESFDIISDGMTSMKSSSTGGVDAWPTDQFLNIWVCKMTYFGIENALLGYAQFPSDMPENEGGDPNANPDADGVVINYLHFGRTYNPDIAPSNLGRTCVHEVGHWLGLRHIWGDEDDPFSGAPGDCTEDDFVYDTPMANQRSNFNCDHNRNSCPNDSAFSNGYWTSNPPDMIENYMDYSADNCMNMFSNGQSFRMASFLETSRRGLWDSTYVAAVGEYDLEAFEVYPNPANQSIRVRFEEFHINSHMQFVNTMGQVVKTVYLDPSQTHIDVSDLPTGMYYLQLPGQAGYKPTRVMIVH